MKRRYRAWLHATLFALKKPFTVRVITVEHTRIRVRSFPPLFEHSRIRSVQERITDAASTGQPVFLESGLHLTYEPITLPAGSTLVGEGVDKTILWSEES